MHEDTGVSAYSGADAFTLRCTFHAGMKGTVVVTAS